MRALEGSLLKSYCAIERIDINKYPADQRESCTLKKSENFVKILKLIYVCLSILPDYCQELLASVLETSSSNSSNRSSKVKLDQSMLLKHIA